MWSDFDLDGRLDVVIAYDSYADGSPYGDAAQFLRQNADGSFSDATTSSGLAGYVANVTAVKAADFDGDGCDDLVFFSYLGASNRLYTGNCRGGFIDATAGSHIAEGLPWCTGVAVADFNSDGAMDIFCGTYNAGPGAARPILWLNDGSAVFVDRALAAGLYSVARNMDVVLPLDEDNDGLIDVYVGASENGWPNDRKDVLLRNLGGNPPVFIDVTDAAGMYPTNQDGSASCGPGVDEYYCDRNASGGGVLDWYEDGAQDVFVTGTDPDSLQRGADFLWMNLRNVLHDGATAPSNDWIDVALKGANTKQSRVLSNRFGIGARVTVIPRFNLPAGAAPSETQCLQYPLPNGIASVAREVLEGNQSQSSPALHFGLGSSLPFGEKWIDCIKVRWPSGFERAYTHVTANTRVVLAEDVGRMKVINVVPNNGANTSPAPTTVTGLHFDRDVSAVPQVLFGSVPATSVTFISDHELRVLPPLFQPPGTVDVTVVNTDGEQDTLLAGYTFNGSSSYVRFKDPVPGMITTDGTVPDDPDFVAARGDERTGVIADGVTLLVVEAEVGGPGTVRFVLDDDGNPNNPFPSGTSVGTATALAGGPAGTTLTVPVSLLADARFVAHAVYRAPQEFIRSAADSALSVRPVWFRSTYIDTVHAEHPMPPRSLDLYRVPVLYVHGMWGGTNTFGWPLMNDPRWIIYRADYSATNDVAFADNVEMAPRVIAELRHMIHARGIAGTRFLVFAHSMGAVLFKIYMSGAAAPFARADNFYSGDVYALVSIGAPFFGSYLAPFVARVQSMHVIGPKFARVMRAFGKSVDGGCMRSLDPASRDTLDIPNVYGTFHVFVGWGGKEMRDQAIALAAGTTLSTLQTALEFFNFTFENFILRCTSGDDFIVCVESQRGGVTGSPVSDFHFADLSAESIHLDSICKEAAPSAAAEQLLNTATSNASVWAPLLPGTPPLSSGEARGPRAVSSTARRASTSRPGETSTVDDVSVWESKEGDSLRLDWNGAASRLWKSQSATLASGACLAVSGGTYLDAHELIGSASAYYELGTDSLCIANGSLAIASTSPASGPAAGGYPITILGTGFDSSIKVEVGGFPEPANLINDTTISSRVPPGDPGTASVLVSRSDGQVAMASFGYTDAGPIQGGATILTPADGSTVVAGTTLTISAVGFGGFTIHTAIAYGKGFASSADSDPGERFSTSVNVPGEAIGVATVGLLARDVGGNLFEATPVTINIVAPPSAALTRLAAEKLVLLDGTPSAQLRVSGVYSDGESLDVTRAPGIVYEMDTQDPRKSGYPYNGTAVAIVGADGMVDAKARGSTICHVNYQGHAVDVVVEVAGIRPTLTIQKPGFISWPYQGAEITYDVVRGKLSGLRATAGAFGNPAVGLSCIKNNFANVTAADAANPPLGEGYFYLMRENRTRNYDESPFWSTRSQTGARTPSIDAAPGACPQ